MKLSDIANRFGATLHGNDMEIYAINSLKSANESELSYCDNEKNAKLLEQTKAGAVLIRSDFVSLLRGEIRAIVCDNPHLVFATLSKEFAKPIFSAQQPAQISSSANVSKSAYISNGVIIDDNTIIMPGVFVGENVKIGKNCVIHPNVVIYNDCIIGDHCHLNANCVIGSDGFGYAHNHLGEHIKIYHNGNVILEDFVEIGSCTTIDRSVFESTIIKKGTKIDNLVQIGHNCLVGDNCLIVGQAGLAGSSELGRNVVMGGQSGTAGHLKVGDFAQIAARGGVSKDLAGGEKYAGAYPIMKLGDFLKLQAKIVKFFKGLK